MIDIITTGGTIEGLEYDDPNQAPKSPPMALELLLQHIENLPNYKFKRLLLKDSRFINNKDRVLVASEIKKSSANKIIVTHGTLTMVETAKHLGGLDLKKTIVLTGSFILGTDKDTDAIFNLEFSFRALMELEYGVYIVMNGEIFPWYNVQKSTTGDMFEPLSF